MPKNTKVYKPKALHEVVLTLKKQGKSVGVITGCFDIVHSGHVNLLQFSKNFVDVLIVGIDSDENVKLLKGDFRPIHEIDDRIKVLSEFSSVDYIFVITDRLSLNSKETSIKLENLYTTISPDYILTTPQFDKHWKNKKLIANKLGIKFIPYRLRLKNKSTSMIVARLQQEVA